MASRCDELVNALHKKMDRDPITQATASLDEAPLHKGLAALMADPLREGNRADHPSLLASPIPRLPPATGATLPSREKLTILMSGSFAPSCYRAALLPSVPAVQRFAWTGFRGARQYRPGTSQLGETKRASKQF